MSENHCKDCCCARSWKALGVTSYTGMSIVEHIERLRSDNDALAAWLAEVEEELAQWRATGESVTRNEYVLSARLTEAEALLREARVKLTAPECIRRHPDYAKNLVSRIDAFLAPGSASVEGAT